MCFLQLPIRVFLGSVGYLGYEEQNSDDTIATNVANNVSNQMIEVNIIPPSTQKNETKLTQSLPSRQILSSPSTMATKNNIDSISQKTDDVFGTKVILMTQDIFVTEE